MRITAGHLIPYRLPLRHPWRSAHGVFTHRVGWLVRLETDAGLLGHGDCAPLPEAGTETPGQALDQLQARLPLLHGCIPPQALNDLDGTDCHAPAARCALETALLDLLAQQAGMPLARWLNPRAPMSVRANAMIGGLDEVVATRAEIALTAGFALLKLKVGMSEPEIELAQLHRLADVLPSAAIFRLDANGAWSRDQAQRFIEGLSELPIESLEEPLAQADVAGLQYLQTLAPFPLALDESLMQFDTSTLLAEMVVRRLVLKPMALGGVRPAYALAQRAKTAGVECVVTTTVDSAVGVLAAAHLAAALDNDLTHGVATSSWLLSDVGNAPPVASGRVLLDDRLGGLGFLAQAFIGNGWHDGTLSLTE